MTRPIATGLLLFAVLAPVSLAAQPQPRRGIFGDPNVWDWAPSRTYHVVNYLLRLHFDEPKGEVFGDEVVTLVPFASDFRNFYFDSSELTIESVQRLGGGRTPILLRFRTEPGRLWITLDRPFARGTRLQVEIVYHGFPRTGLFFVNPSAVYPRWPREVWSQGESEFNHYWFPCWDHPNDKATSETITTVPAGQIVVSNGRLAGVTLRSGKATYDWVEPVPHSSYLISIAVGPWRKVSQNYDGKPVDIYVPRSVDADTALRAFGLTPDAMAFYSEIFGVDYPYEKYAQTAVHNFTAGGMENISATTQTDWALHDARADADFPSWPLMAHELAHQWFGDLATTRDWPNLWLNEGFATFIADLYAQHHLGDDAYRYAIWQDQRAARGEDDHRYRRPIVDRHYTFPEQMFDGTTYSKGGVVLDMLRTALDGPAAAHAASPEEPLFQALHRYLVAHRAGNVDTHDLEAAIRNSTGRDLGWFFREWVFEAGYPQYRVTEDYDAARQAATVTVAQTQTQIAETPIFRMPIELAFHGANGATKTVTVRDDAASQTFTVPLNFAPAWMAFDPGDQIYKTLDYRPPLAALAAQAEGDPAMMSRLWATGALGHRGAAAEPALAEVLDHDAFYGVRVQAAAALGRVGGAAARAALLEAVSQRDSRVRAAAARALSGWASEPAVYAALAGVLQHDASYAAAAAAAGALGRGRNPAAFALLANTIQARPEIHVWTAAVAALAATHDPRAADVLLAAAAAGMPERVRITALSLMPEARQALVAGDRSRLEAAVAAALADPFGYTRAAGERLAGELRLNRFRPFLEAQAANAAEPQQQENAREDLELFTKRAKGGR